jgi:hypothetical protein
LLGSALCLALRPPGTLELKPRARRRPARQQIRIGDATGCGIVELGDERAARVRRDGGDRSGTRTEAEPMQGRRSFGFGIERHVSRVLFKLKLRTNKQSPGQIILDLDATRPHRCPQSRCQE